MPFKPGNKLYKARKSDRGGRPSKEQVAKDLTAAERAKAKLESRVDDIMECYLGLATSGSDSATTRHAIDKLVPDDNGKEKTGSGDTFIQFLFGNTTPTRREADVRLPEEEQRRDLNGGAIRFLGSNGRG